MANYLDFYVGNRVDIPVITLDADFEVEIRFRVRSLTNTSLLGDLFAQSSVFLTPSGGYKLDLTSAISSTERSGIVANTWHVLRMFRTSGTVFSQLDGGTVNNDGDFAQSVIFDAFGVKNTTGYDLELDYCKITKAGVLERNYRADDSNGTGDFLPEIENSQDGTLNGFPADNSQWVTYVDEGTVGDYYLKLEQHVTLTAPINRTSDTSWAIEFQATDNHAVQNQPNYIISFTNNTRFSVNMIWDDTADKISVRLNGVYQTLVWVRTPVLADNLPHVIALEYDGANLSGTIDGVAADSVQAVGAGYLIESITEFGFSTGGPSDFDLYRFRYWSEAAKTNLIHDYNASSSNGAGSTLLDDASGNNGAIAGTVNWVSYTPPSSNVAPTANAGTDQTNITQGATVTLNATGSGDSDGTIASYAWTQTVGTTVALSDSAIASPTFTAPASEETLTFEVTVTDNEGATSTDTVNIAIASEVVNAPTANAGVDQSVISGEVFRLNAVLSTTFSGQDATYVDSFLWSQVSGGSVTFIDPLTWAKPSFTAPTITEDTPLVFRLVVTDDGVQSVADDITITVKTSAALPTANSGNDVASATAGTSVSLDGTSSTSNTSITKYKWTQTSGAYADLDDRLSGTPSFTVPTATHRQPVAQEIFTSNVASTPTGLQIPSQLDRHFNLTYLGAMRAEHGTNPLHGVSAWGTLQYYATNDSLFFTGRTANGPPCPVGEFSVGNTLSLDAVVSNLPAFTPIQTFVDILALNTAFTGSTPDQVNGFLPFNGSLIVTSQIFYDGSGTNVDNIQVLTDINNLSSGGNKGAMQLQGAAHSAGWMHEIPAEWQVALGGTHLSGWASNGAINSRFSIGPSLFTFNPQDAIDADINGDTSIPTTALLDYSLTNPLNSGFDVYTEGLSNPVWNTETVGKGGFIIPNTDLYMILGSHAGINSGIGYKSLSNDGTSVGGYTPYDLEDEYNYFWIYAIDDIVNQTNVYDAQPIHFGRWSHPHDELSNYKINGATFDYTNDRLFVSLGGAGGSNNSVILAYTLTAKTEVTAIDTNLTDMIFELEVTDTEGLRSTDTVTVAMVANTYTGANAGVNKSVLSGTVYMLDGRASTRPTAVIEPPNYTWTQISGTAVTLDDSTIAVPRFTAPTVSVDTPLVFRLVVDFGGETSVPDEVTITVKTAASLPTANAGTNFTVTQSTDVALNATASTGNSAVSHRWYQLSGPYAKFIDLDDRDSATPTIRVPSLSAVNPLAQDIYLPNLVSTPASIQLPAGLSKIADVTYAGAFRFNHMTAEGRTDYTWGAIGLGAGGTMYLASKDQNSVGEFTIPALSFEADIANLPIAPVVQNFVDHYNVITAGGGELDTSEKRINGIYEFNSSLILTVENRYDAGTTQNSDNMQVFDDASDLANGTHVGYLQLEGRSFFAGGISEVPASLQASVGSSYLIGWAPNRSIISRYSQGPALALFNPQDALDQTVTGDRAVANTPILYYDAANPVIPTGIYFNTKKNIDPIWSSKTNAFVGFFIPNTNYYMFVGNNGGIREGVGYKITDDSGTFTNGPTANESADLTAYYWIYDVNDIVNATELYEPKPVMFGRWAIPFYKGAEGQQITNGFFDSANSRLYLSYNRSISDTVFSAHAMVVAFDITGAATPDETVDDTMVFQVKVTDAEGLFTFDTVTVALDGAVSDTTAPVITIDPIQTSYTVVEDSVFTPPVATSTDETDAPKTLTPSGTVDTSTIGTYTLTYTDADSAGNAAEPIIVTINVIAAADITAPVITVSGPESTTITQGDVVPTFTASAIDDVDGTVPVIVGGDTVDSNTVGTYVITYNSSDAAGNSSPQTTRTVIVEEPVDNTAPVITVSGLASTTIAFGGVVPTFTSSTDDGSTVVITGSVDENLAGTYYYYYNATDVAGNIAIQVIRTVVVEAEIDVNAPVITIVPNQTIFNLTQNAVFTPPIATSTDNVDSTQTITPTGAVDVTTLGTYTLTYSDSDSAGNVAIPIVVTINVIDIVAPTITVSGNELTTITEGDSAPTFTSSTDDGSVVVVTGSIDTATPGTYYLYYNSSDLSGNEATEVVRTVVVEINYSAIEFNQSESISDVFHEQIDQIFAAAYEESTDVNGLITYLSIDNYNQAEYFIFNSAGVKIVSLTIGEGIIKSGTDFIVHVPSQELNFTGSFEHALVAISGTKRDLVFKRSLIIKKGY